MTLPSQMERYVGMQEYWQDRALIMALAEAGVTWWVEYVPAGELDEMCESVKCDQLGIE